MTTTKLWASTGSGRIEIEMTMEQAQGVTHSGRCDDDVLALSQVPEIASQLAGIDAALLRKELSEYGAWDDGELADHQQNLQRILWLMAGDIAENHNQKAL